MLKSNTQRFWAQASVLLTLWVFTDPRIGAAQDHVVPIAELHGQLQGAAQTRANNLADVERVLSLPQAQELMAKANLNPDQVHRAVATLDERELARLATQARAAELDVQGGIIVGL